MIIQKYKLSFEPNKVCPIVRVSQYDESRRIVFYVDKTITSATVMIGETELTGTVNDETVTVDIPSSLTQTSGQTKGEIRADEIGSLNFIFEVDSTPIEAPTQSLTLSMNNRSALLETPLEMAEIKPSLNLNIVEGIGTLDIANTDTVNTVEEEIATDEIETDDVEETEENEEETE